MIVPSEIKNGEFVSEEFISNIKKCKLVEWNYRDNNGLLHVGVCKSIGQAKLKASTFGYLFNKDDCTI